MKYNQEANRVVEEALLCKIFKCTPEQLENIDWDKVELFKEVYMYLAKESPMSMFI
jgi:hypothetical protein